MGSFASRVSGSSDLYESSGKGPASSLNFVTSHDGFTLNDLVSYKQKHNDENGEHNRDATDANYSDNCGAEGPSTDPGQRCDSATPPSSDRASDIYFRFRFFLVISAPIP
jgi:isoamylase